MLIATVIVLQVISAILMVLFILLHAGRGGGLSDMFGGGSGLAGGTAVERNLDRVTVATAVVFAVTTFYLAWKWV
ncbi:MAG: preprotein translocase subunit SecG [Actinomycetota bacterium]|jgi:preprotein translocase subunit SecG